MITSGWGRYPRLDCHLSQPQTRAELQELVRAGGLIPRGGGRAYGDSALNPKSTVDITRFNQLLAFDGENGLLTAGAGVQLRDITATFVKRGWFVHVTPGTSFVTVGGAIASDVHGKNHHGAGTFCDHVEEITMMLGAGEVVTVSPNHKPDLFRATCGGMGLTGIILSAKLKLMPIKSSRISQTTMKLGCLEGVCEQFEIHADATYSVAWIDCFARGPQLGRSVLMLGEHAEDGELDTDTGEALSIPIDAPSFLLNDISMRAFNSLYYALAKKTERVVPLTKYFYPLDAIGNWNRLYGRHGFVQYQFVLPEADGVANMRKILKKISDAGTGSFLAVLKRLGEQNQNLLSFPRVGYTLALDFRMSERTRALLKELDDMVVGMGGRVYLTKDALMSERTFKATYPKWEQFEAVRKAYGAQGKFASAQSQRLGLA